MEGFQRSPATHRIAVRALHIGIPPLLPQSPLSSGLGISVGLANGCQLELIGLGAIEHSGARMKLTRTNQLSTDRAKTLEVDREIQLGKKEPTVIHLVLQAGGELIDVGGRNVAAHAILKERRAVTAYGIAADLQKQSVHRIRVIFLWSEAHDFIQGAAERKPFTV